MIPTALKIKSPKNIKYLFAVLVSSETGQSALAAARRRTTLEDLLSHSEHGMSMNDFVPILHICGASALISIACFLIETARTLLMKLTCERRRVLHDMQSGERMHPNSVLKKSTRSPCPVRYKPGTDDAANEKLFETSESNRSHLRSITRSVIQSTNNHDGVH